jgi:hypothetical protein
MAHIHQAPKGVNGPIVVPLIAPIGGSSAGCATVDPLLGQAIADEPRGFYVNVHTTMFPGGAIRGQLKHGHCAAWWCDKHSGSHPTPTPTPTPTESAMPTQTLTTTQARSHGHHRH